MTVPGGRFFDLGGTLLALDDRGEIDWSAGRVTVLPGVVSRLTALAGTPVFVVSNQADVPPSRVDDYCAALNAAVGGAIVEFAICAHPRDAGCRCRKPRPGLVVALAQRHGIDLAASTLVGDTDTDQQLAAAAGIGTFYWAHDYFGLTGAR